MHLQEPFNTSKMEGPGIMSEKKTDEKHSEYFLKKKSTNKNILEVDSVD